MPTQSDASARGAEQAIDGARRQTFGDAIRTPLAAREGAQALRRGEPHRAIRGLGDRADDVRGQPVRGRVGAEADAGAVRPTDARARAERAGPDRPITTPVQRDDAARCETIPGRERGRVDRAARHTQARQSSLLSSHPDIVATSRDRVDDVPVETRGGDALDASMLKPVQASLHRGEPCPAGRRRRGPGPHDRRAIPRRGRRR